MLEFALTVRPIPKPLYGKNLRSVLGRYRWSKLRQSIVDERGLTCETCGVAVEDSSLINAHEEWGYDTSKTPAVATVEKIILNCRPCHHCEHFFNTLMMYEEGKFTGHDVEDAIKQFCRVNGVGQTEFDRHRAEAFAKWERLSELEWIIDYGPFASLVIERHNTMKTEPSKPRQSGPKHNPFDDNRINEFVSRLDALCQHYGYWIGRTSTREKLPLHIRQPGSAISGYDVVVQSIIALVPPNYPDAGEKLEIRLSWSDDPISAPSPKSLRQKRRGMQRERSRKPRR